MYIWKRVEKKKESRAGKKKRLHERKRRQSESPSIYIEVSLSSSLAAYTRDCLILDYLTLFVSINNGQVLHCRGQKHEIPFILLHLMKNGGPTGQENKKCLTCIIIVAKKKKKNKRNKQKDAAEEVKK